MTEAGKERLDPGFWIALILVGLLLYLTYKCH
jgi:hypothetical protein